MGAPIFGNFVRHPTALLSPVRAVAARVEVVGGSVRTVQVAVAVLEASPVVVPRAATL
jgi:hypothetical protein